MSGILQRVRCAFVASAFGLVVLAACQDVLPPDGTITVTPPSTNLNVGDQITLVATVSTGTTSRSVTWTSSNTSVATVDTNGRVTAIGGGTATVIATSVANSAVKGAAAITVVSTGFGLRISAIKHDGVDANLSDVFGQLDVSIILDFGTQKIAEVDLLINCGGADTVVATQNMAGGGAAGGSAERATTPIILSFNTAGFKNGTCVLKVRATTATGTIVTSSGTLITLNNPTTASATLLRPEHLGDTRLQRVKLLS